MTQPDLTQPDEVSEADIVEEVLTGSSTMPRPGVPTRAFEANEYDAIEQDRVVEFDDDYR
jgi:hypothetical protein